MKSDPNRGKREERLGMTVPQAAMQWKDGSTRLLGIL